MRILVVEDETAVRHGIDRILTARGHHVLTAPSVFDAMALLLDFPDPPDLALLGLSLPGMAALAYADRLQEQFPAIRLAFITARIDGFQAAEAKTRGLILLKPLTPQTLYDIIGPDA